MNNIQKMIIFIVIATVIAAVYFSFNSQRLKKMVEQYGDFNIPKKALLDYVDVGIQKSELAHPGLYGFNVSKDEIANREKTSTYDREDTINQNSGISWRNTVGKWGVVLSSKKAASLVRINIMNRSYSNFMEGSPEYSNPPELKETKIEVSCNGINWEVIGTLKTSIGTLKTSQQEKYKTFEFPLSISCPKSGDYYRYYIIADDDANLYSSGHFGKTVNWIAIYEK